MIQTDVVDSDIPLLLSKESMKSAKVVLDLEKDTAKIFDIEVPLDSTTCGHYAVPIYDTAETSLFTTKISSMQEEDKEKMLEKIHKQFAHPTRKKVVALLHDVDCWDDSFKHLLDGIYQRCETCLKFSKTPSRPVVCSTVVLPLATSLTKCLKCGLVQDWDPLKSLLQIMGENRDMAENLNIHVINTAAQSPWQNGICERNHAVVDCCLEKILEDNPTINRDVALAWAINAKNCLQMWSGFPRTR